MDRQRLVRLVRTSGGSFLLDAGGRLPGRGAYLCPSESCLRIALKRKSFDRAFRQPVPPEGAAALEARFREYVEALARAFTGGSPGPAARGPGR